MLKIAEKRAQKTRFLCQILQQTLFNKTRNESIQKIAGKKTTENTITLLNTKTNSLIKQEMNIYRKLLEKEQRKHNSNIAASTYQ